MQILGLNILFMLTVCPLDMCKFYLTFKEVFKFFFLRYNFYDSGILLMLRLLMKLTVC